MSKKVMPYDGMFDNLVKDYTCHKSNRRKIGVVISEVELTTLRKQNSALLEELTEFKLLELSLGKRIENLVSDVDEHEAKNQALLEALKKILRQAISSGLDYLFVLDIIDSAREAIQENQNE